jgi:glyoxylate reductase
VKVIVSAPLPGAAVDSLRTEHEVVVGASPYGLGHDGLVALAHDHADASGLVAHLGDRIDGTIFAAFPRLRVVANYAVGVDNIDLAAADTRGVVVCNTPDVLTDATADLTWALILATARRVAEGDRFVRAGAWKGWSPTLMLGAHVTGATLGIVGLGRIGRAVAKRAAGFRMRVLAATRDSHPSEPDVEHVTLAALLAQSDFVSLHCPLTERTRNLVDAQSLTRMKRTAILVNTARGAIVDEPALAAALRNGVIAGAGLDVFAHEPAVHPALIAAPNTVLLPHLGSASATAREAMAQLACDAVRDVLAGREPRHRVRGSASVAAGMRG